MAKKNKPEIKDAPALKEDVKFDYLKSNFHREIIADGAFGGLTPRGYIQMSIFCERNPIPKQTVHKIKKDGTLSNEIREERIAREAIIRSIETTLIMDLDTATVIRNWLDNHIKKAKELSKYNKGNK